MRFVERYVKKERLALVAKIFQPVDRLIGYKMACVSAQLTGRGAVANKIRRIIVGRLGI